MYEGLLKVLRAVPEGERRMAAGTYSRRRTALDRGAVLPPDFKDCHCVIGLVAPSSRDGYGLLMDIFPCETPPEEEAEEVYTKRIMAFQDRVRAEVTGTELTLREANEAQRYCDGLVWFNGRSMEVDDRWRFEKVLEWVEAKVAEASLPVPQEDQ